MDIQRPSDHATAKPEICRQAVVDLVRLFNWVADRVFFRRQIAFHRRLSHVALQAGVLFLALQPVVRTDNVEKTIVLKRITQNPTAGKPSADPLFIDGPVAIQQLVTDEDTELLRVTSVTFKDGARNRPHRHTCDQVLIGTHGRGFIATDDEEVQISPGDVILIPKDTRHWHGAETDTDFTHVSILTPSVMSIAD